MARHQKESVEQRLAYYYLAGGCFFLRSGVSQPLAAMLSVQDLARLCATCPQLRHAAQDLAHAAMQAQHGLSVVRCTLGDLRVLEDTPLGCEIDFSQPRTRQVRQGNALSEVCVGSSPWLVAQAQCPPKCGDAWSARVELKRGRYSLELHGWQNPSHGVLSLFLDGLPLGDFDWSGPCTRRCAHVVELHVRWTGAHHILARTNRSNAALCRRRRHWICLRHLSIRAG